MSAASLSGLRPPVLITVFSDFLNGLDDQLAIHRSEAGHHVEEKPAGGSPIRRLRIVVCSNKDGSSLPDYIAISKTMSYTSSRRQA
jgi:hypothetical protein